MKRTSIDRSKTFFSSPFIEQYRKGELDSLYSYKPSLADAIQRIADRKDFDMEIRNTLCNSLLKQYDKASIDLADQSPVKENIYALLNPTTYTVTTGQQIHIGLGPLYVLYKILDALKIAREVEQSVPGIAVVPVFWMASEDHDREEIETIHLFGKDLIWDTDQTGAVGRMTVDGVGELWEDIRSNFNLDEGLESFVNAAREAYEGGTIADGFRRLLHRYFETEGLVILDGDDRSLKQVMTGVWKDELLGKNAEALTLGTENVKKAGYKPQVVVRPCNLFLLRDKQRLRLEVNDQEIHTAEGEFVCAKDKVEDFVLKNAEALSPNAALRPLYQETILPNLVYVGGGAELKYWGQLKPLFTNYRQNMPVLHLRTSGVIVPSKVLEKAGIEDVSVLFEEEKELVSHFGQDAKEKMRRAEEGLEDIIQRIKAYKEMLHSDNQGYNHDSTVDKIVKRLEVILETHLNRMHLNHEKDHHLNKVLKIRSKYFNSAEIQERIAHLMAFSAIFDPISPEMGSGFGFENSFKINICIA